jgi:diacylglycerol kinase
MGGRAGREPALRPPAQALPASFRSAALGLRQAWRSERNFRVQCAFGWAALGAAALVGLPRGADALLLALVGAVLGMEAMNSALEAAVDLASPGRQPLAGAAKDLAAGAVFAVALGALGAGVALFWPLAALPAALLRAMEAHPLGAGAWLAGLAALVGLAAGPLQGRRAA